MFQNISNGYQYFTSWLLVLLSEGISLNGCFTVITKILFQMINFLVHLVDPGGYVSIIPSKLVLATNKIQHSVHSGSISIQTCMI